MIRKYKKPIFWGLVILIVPTFVLWGGSFGHGDRREEAENPYAVVAQVGDMPVSAEQYRRALDLELQQMNRGGQEMTYKDLAQNGTADEVLDNLITGALYTQAIEKQPVSFERAFLVEQIKQDPEFKNEQGLFDAAKWNAWLDDTEGIDWNAQYAQVTDMLKRRLYAKQVYASARVLDSEVKKLFEEENTKLQVRYVTIDPKIVPTDEQIQAHYDANKSQYDIPAQRTAEFIAVSMTPSRPAIVDEIVDRARKGEDFAELAKTYSSAPNKDQGGEMDWAAETIAALPYKEPLFNLKVNEISDPVEGPGGYYIYKLDEERKDAVTGQRDVKGREIQILLKLEDAERTARKEKADQLAAKVKDSKDLQAAAAEAGLEVKKTGLFSEESMSIENLPPEDVWSFRAALAGLAPGEVSEVVTCPRNLYVAKVVEVVPSVPQPLEAVRDKVVKDAENEIRRSPEYADKAATLAADVQARAHSLLDVQTMFPELGAEVKESKEFNVKDFDYSGGLFWNPREIYGAVGAKEPGAFAGPIRDMIGKTYFIELMKKTPPDETAWKDAYPKEEMDLRKNLLMAKQQARLSDYLKDLRDSAESQVPIIPNTQLISNLLGLTEPENAEAPLPEVIPATPLEASLPASAEGAAAAPAAEAPAPAEGDAALPEAATGTVPSQPAPAKEPSATSPAGSADTPAAPSASQ